MVLARIRRGLALAANGKRKNPVADGRRGEGNASGGFGVVGMLDEP